MRERKLTLGLEILYIRKVGLRSTESRRSVGNFFSLGGLVSPTGNVFLRWVGITAYIIGIDNFPYRQIFVLDKSRPKKLHSRKQPLKSSKIPKFG